MQSKYLPDFRIIIPTILGLMTITSFFPMPHQVQQQTQQEQSQ